ELAKSGNEFQTALMWLPANESLALAIAELFLSSGVDPAVTNKDGATAADLARRRGQDQVAAMLDAAISGKSTQGGGRPGEAAVEGLAKDLASAFESEDAEALQRLNRFRGRSLSREDLRADVWHSVYKVRQAKGRPGCFELADAKEFLAREAGFGNWTAFVN